MSEMSANSINAGTIQTFVKQPSCNETLKTCKEITGQARLIRSHSSARFSFELSGNLNSANTIKKIINIPVNYTINRVRPAPTVRKYRAYRAVNVLYP